MMDHVVTKGTKMVVESDEFRDWNEPDVAVTAIVSNTLPDPVLESAKTLLDSMLTSSAKLAKMLKPVPSPVKNSVQNINVKPSVTQTFGYHKNSTGVKINRYNSNNWRRAVLPKPQTLDVKLMTTAASNDILLTLQPVPHGNDVHKVPYYARNRSFQEFTIQPQAKQIVEINHDKTILEWHRKHVQKLMRFAASSKSRNLSSNLKAGNCPIPHPRPDLSYQTGVPAVQKRKYSEISDRYYQYLNKPKRARHDAFQVIFRSHILLNHVESVRSTAVDEQTLYPRKFLSWPSGKVVMPGYFPQRYYNSNANQRNNLKRKRTWSMYRVAKPKPPPAANRASNNKHLYSSLIKKFWKKNLAAEDRIKWNPVSRKYLVTPSQHKLSKTATSKEWFRYPSVLPRKNPVQNFNIAIKSQTMNNPKKFSTVTTKTQPHWRTAFKPEQVRNAISVPRAQHKLKDIRSIFKCKDVPNPIFFESYNMYSTNCVLFQIRRLVSFKAMKQGRLEKKVRNRNEEECNETYSEMKRKRKPVCNIKLLPCSVLISSSTEAFLSSWVKTLDGYSFEKSIDRGNVSNQNTDVSKCWLHVCRGAIIDCAGIAYPEYDDYHVSKEVIYAWALDEPCNDTSTATHVINSNVCPSDRNNGNETTGVVTSSGKKSETCGSLLVSPVPKMQRSRSQLKCSPGAEVDMRRQKCVVPEPGYCVRYRLSLCTLDCACTSSVGILLPMLTFQSGILHEKTNNLLPWKGHGVEDADSRRIAENVTGGVSSERAEDVCQQNRTQFNGISVESHCQDVVTHDIESAQDRAEENGTGCTHSIRNDKTAAVVANMSSDAGDYYGPVLPLASSEPFRQESICLYRVGKSLLALMARHEREDSRRPTISEAVCNVRLENSDHNTDTSGHHSCHAICGSCEVERSKSNFDTLDRVNATNRDTSNNVSASKTARVGSDGGGNSSVKRGALDGLEMVPLDNECSEIKRYITDASFTDAKDQIKLRDVDVNATKNKSLSKYADRSQCAFDVHDLTKDSEWVVIDSTFDRSGEEDSEVSETIEGREIIDMPLVLRSYASLESSIVQTKSEISDAKAISNGDSDGEKDALKLSNFCKAKPAETTVNGTVGNSLTTTANSSSLRCNESVSSFKTTPASSKTDNALLNEIERNQIKPDDSLCGIPSPEIQNEESDKLADSETRSSRRLRSRANAKKRGRYETDYVSDIPKAAKKPKKIYPTNGYDNEDFWQFYSHCENTVYSQNMLLQYKYIKLFKSKGITSDSATLPTQFSNAISHVPASSKKRPAVPKNGIMPFLEKYTKQRKTPPELPTASDDHCAYCGRSFTGRQKKEYEQHVARHGMQYQVLSVPRLPKKKKKTFKAAKKVDNPATTNVGITNAEAKEILLASSQNQRFPFGGETSHSLDSIKPLSRPSCITMGHRKQTARKSFSIASTLPKDVLIAALECEMRAKSTAKNGTRHARGSECGAVDMPSPELSSKNPYIDRDLLMHGYLPTPNSARKTLTGLPITYNHLDRNFM